MGSHALESGQTVAGNAGYAVATTGEYGLLDLVPCSVKNATEVTVAFLCASVVGIDLSETEEA